MRKRRILSGFLAALYSTVCMGTALPVIAAAPESSVEEYTDMNGIVYTCDSTKKTASVTGYNGSSDLLTIPGVFNDGVNDYKVTSVSSGAFMNNTDLVRVDVPENTEIIGEDAFSGCSNLIAVSFPSTLKTVEPGVFKDCPAMSNIFVDEANKNFVFSDNALYTYDRKTLLFCCPGSAKEEFKIPNTVESVYDYAFYPCESTNVVLNEKIGKLSNQKTGDIIISGSTSSVGDKFLTNVRFRSLVVPENVTYISPDAVYHKDKNSAAMQWTIKEYSMKGVTGSYAETFAEKMNREQGYKISFDGSLGTAEYMLKAEIKDNAVVLDWLRTYNADRYVVRRTEAPSNGKEVRKTITGTSYTDRSVRNDITYYYSVCAIKDDNTYEAFSKELTVSVTGIKSDPVTEISGKITNYSSVKNLVGKAFVEFMSEDGQSAEAEVKDDGTFVFEDAKIGTTYTMYLTAQDKCPLFSEEVTVKGSDPVNVTCELRIYGDVNGSGNVDVNDATQILRYEVGYTGSIRNTAGDVNMYAFTAADINDDGSVDAKDAALILRYYTDYGNSYLYSLISIEP